MTSKYRSSYLAGLDVGRSRSGVAGLEELGTSYVHSPSSSAYWLQNSRAPIASVLPGSDSGTAFLRKSLSGSSTLDSPLSATGHRPASKAQRTDLGNSSTEQQFKAAAPGRMTTRSMSNIRGSNGASSIQHPIATAMDTYTAAHSKSSSAAPLSSYYSLPASRQLTTSAAPVTLQSQYTLPSRKAASNYPLSDARITTHRSVTPSSSRLQRLQQAYGEPLARSTSSSSSSRSVSAGRRLAADVASSSLPKTLSSGIASLGSRPRSTSTARGATFGRSMMDATTASTSSSSRVGSNVAGCSPSLLERRLAASTSQNSLGRGIDADVASSSSMSGRSSLFGRSRSHSYEDEGSAVRAQAVTDGRAASRTPLPADESASSSRSGLSRHSSTVSSSNYQTSYQAAYSVPSSSLRKLSFKHDAHGERIQPSKQQDLIQAVPSGSGRVTLQSQQDQMPPLGGKTSSPGVASAKALITAALSKAGLSSPSKGFVGLSNLGNTCFANATIQCLVAIPELVAYFLTAGAGLNKPTGLVSGSFCSLVQQLWGAKSSAIDPYGFMRACGAHEKAWKDGRQHDAQEYLRSILEAMQTELNRVKGKPPYKELKGEGSVSQQADEAWDYAHSRSSSLIQDVFAGQLQSTLQCPHCQALSHTFDEFMDLSLPLPQKSGLSLRGGQTCTVQGCLDAFTETETLEEEEGYNCQACKRRGVCATKKLTVYRCPPVLVLHLKRFSANSGSFFGRFSAMSKDSTSVDIVADTLDMSPYCSTFARKQSQKPVYKLTAITNHSGSMSGGHYTAQCRSALDDRWYDCNDSSVRLDNHVDGPSSSAYLLFYSLQD